MGLNIALDPHGTGLVCRYWRIGQAHLDHVTGQATIWLHGFTDEAARASGRAGHAAMALVLDAADLPHGLHAAGTATLYEALKLRAAAEAAGTALVHAAGSIGPALLAGARDC